MKLRNFDPMYYLLALMLREFLSIGLGKKETSFVHDNIDKHRKSLWMCALTSACSFYGLKGHTGDMDLLIMALIAPVMVMGGAWFSMSFGSVPAKLVAESMSITFWMFTAFLVSFSTMLIAVGFVSPPVLWPVFGLIFMAALTACIKYDTADGLKAGLDESMLKFSRAALLYYQREGIDPDSIEHT